MTDDRWFLGASQCNEQEETTNDNSQVWNRAYDVTPCHRFLIEVQGCFYETGKAMKSFAR